MNRNFVRSLVSSKAWARPDIHMIMPLWKDISIHWKMILYISIIIVQRMNSTQQSKNLRMCNITMYVRILIIITKHLTRLAMGLYNPCGKILGHSVTKKLDHNKTYKWSILFWYKASVCKCKKEITVFEKITSINKRDGLYS